MYENYGAVVDQENKTVYFSLFIPDKKLYQTNAGLPQFNSIKVVGDFDSQNPTEWSKQLPYAPVLIKTKVKNGWDYKSNVIKLEDGFFQYKYVVEFKNGDVRWINDPYTRYHNNDGKYDNSGFVIGGTVEKADIIEDRKPLKDLIIYELMIDDFTRNLISEGESQIDVLLRDSTIEYFKSLGINAIEFMPWTAWTGGGFNWGYMPYLFFSVTNRYVHNSDPLEKLSKLKKLIAKLHENGIQVIMDGVFNHVSSEFPYHRLYEEVRESPYTGIFKEHGFGGEDLDFNNKCTCLFILDVCKYWIDEFGIDGIRLDNTKGFYDYSGKQVGLKELMNGLKEHFKSDPPKYKNIALILEHIGGNERGVAADVEASGYWFDNFLWDMSKFINSRYGHIENSIMKILSSSIHWKYDSARHILPVNYIESHDSSTIVNRISNPGDNRDMLWKTQPYMLALFTMPGAIMLHNGQEYGEDYWIPKMHEEKPHEIERVSSRPLRWNYLHNDARGQYLFSLYKKLTAMRKAHPSLSSINFYPAGDKAQQDHFIDGHGFDRDRQMVIYQRWGHAADGRLEHFVVVLNFSDYSQFVDIPFPINGEWRDILNDEVRDIQNGQSEDEKINSNWGRIFYRID